MDSCRWGGPRAWPLCDLGHDTAIPNPSTNQIETKRYLRYPVLLSRWLIIFTHAPLAFIFHAHITKQDPYQVFILIKGKKVCYIICSGKKVGSAFRNTA